MNLLGGKVAFTHAGHGTSKLNEIGEPFSGIKRSVLGEKNIFMYRNPLDTAVSMYFQIHKKDFQINSRKFLKKYFKLAIRRRLPPKDINKFVLHPIWGVENICKFNRAWHDLIAESKDGLILSYEDARNDPSSAIQRLIDFTGAKSMNPTEIAEKSSFDSMKKLEMQGGSKELRLHGLRNSDQESMKVRRGVIGGYRDYLSEETILEARKVAHLYNFEV